MAKTSKSETARKPWLRPAVQKIAAGAAESGTRSNNRDTTFQTS